MQRPCVLEGCQNRQYCIYWLSGMFLLLQVTPEGMSTAVPGAVIHHPLLPLWQFIQLYWPFLIVSYLGTFQVWMKMQKLFSHWIYPVYTTMSTLWRCYSVAPFLHVFCVDLSSKSRSCEYSQGKESFHRTLQSCENQSTPCDSVACRTVFSIDNLK